MTPDFVSQLGSDKLRERQDGLRALRESLARDGVAESLDTKGDGKAWLYIFQAVFKAVVIERRTYLQKGVDNASAAVKRRLEEAASTLRWLTERSVLFLNKKVVHALNEHIMQTIVHQGQLLLPIALDLLNALRTILSYPPHLDRVDSATWIKLVSLSFAVLLDQTLESDLADDEDSDPESAGDASEEESYEKSGSGSRKRRKAHSLRSTLSPAPTTSRHRTVSNEKVSCTAILVLLLRSPRAPYLSIPNLSNRILHKLHQFFIMYPTETTAHLEVVQSVNAALSQLELNAKAAVTEFGVKTWQPLVELLGTKNTVVKEGVIIALRTLFPFVTHRDVQVDMLDELSKLGKRLEEDAERKANFGTLGTLELDYLRLEIKYSQTDKRLPFEAETLRSGCSFDSTQALRWAALELHADSLAKVSISQSTIYL